MNYRPQVQRYLTEPCHPYLNFNLDHPPAVPNIYVFPDLEYLYPELCAMVAGELQDGAKQNAARCYAYNVFAENGFNNAAFAELMSFVAGKVALDAWETRQQPERIANQLVHSCITMAVGSMVDTDWGIEMDDALDQNLAYNISNAAREYEKHAAQVTDFLDAVRQQGQPQQRRQQDWNSGRGSNSMGSAFHDTRSRMSSGRGGGHFNNGPRSTASGGMARQPAARGQGRFGNPIGNRGQQPPQQQQAQGRYSGRRFSRQAPTSEFEQQPQPADDVLRQPEALRSSFRTRPDQRGETATTQQEQPMAQVNEKLVWKPSQAQWYLQAFNPQTHYQILTRTDTGDVIQQIIEKDPADMDYDRHAIPGYLGTVPKHQDVTKSAQRTAKILEAANALIANDVLASELAQQEKPDYTTVVHDATVVELSADAAWFEGNLMRFAFDNAGERPDLFRVSAVVAEPIIGTQSYTGYLKALGECKNYDELCEKINESYRACGPEFFAVVNNKITALINRQLAQNLSMRARITSFASDWPETQEGLAKFSERAALALLSNEQRIIKSAFSLLDDPYQNALEERVRTAVNFQEGKAPSVTFVPSYRTLTYLNVDSGQLEVELAKGMPTLLTEEGCPALYNAVQGIVETASQAERVECHYIRTNDCRIYEVTSGYMVPKSYLITLVK